MRTINYVINLTHGSVVDTFEGLDDEVPEAALVTAQRLANDCGDTFAVARLKASCQADTKRAPEGPLPLTVREAFEKAWEKQVEMLAALEATFTGREPEIYNSLKESLLPQVKQVQADAFSAGVEWSRLRERQIAQADRRGSSLRGRRVKLFRPLTEEELGRENDYLTNGGFHWPCLELDDGTVVYAAKKGKSAPGDDPFLEPALLVGQKSVDGEVKKVSFNMEVAEIQVQSGGGE